MSPWWGVDNTTESRRFFFGNRVALWLRARLPRRLGAVPQEVVGSIFTFHIFIFLSLLCSYLSVVFICCVRLLQQRNISPVSPVLVSSLWLLKDTLFIQYILVQPSAINLFLDFKM